MHEPPPDKLSIELEQLGPLEEREQVIGLEFIFPLNQGVVAALSKNTKIACQILHTVGYRGYRFEHIKKILDANWKVFGWPLRPRALKKIYLELQKVGIMRLMTEEKPEKARYLYYWGKEIEDDEKPEESGGLRDVRQGRKRFATIDDLVSEGDDHEVEG